MKKFWFKPKKYGVGFYPISAEGWMATLIFISLLLISAYTDNFLTLKPHQQIVPKNGFRFLLDVVMLSGLFTVLFKDRLEGGLQWRWGNKK